MIQSLGPIRVFIPTLLAMILLAACSTSQPPEPPADSRYSINQDRAPSVQIDPASVPDAVPEPVARTLAGNRSPYTVLGETYRVMATEEGYAERGVASWYGEKFHGHFTSNGEVFDMFKATAAHKSLPIPSFLRVTNLENNRSIIVRVNDRGPFHSDRVIDLSYGAAVKLGFANIGTARVHLEAILPPKFYGEARQYAVNQNSRAAIEISPGQGNRYLQVGAFSNPTTAQRVVQQVEKITTLPIFIQQVVNNSNQVLHRVRVGPIIDNFEISNITQRVIAANLGSPYTVMEE